MLYARAVAVAGTRWTDDDLRGGGFSPVADGDTEGGVAHLVCIDDDETAREALARMLVARGHQVEAVGTALVAGAGSRSDDIALVIANISPETAQGFQTLRTLCRTFGSTPVAVLARQGAAGAALEAVRAGAFDYAVRPVFVDYLELLVARAQAHNQQLRAHRELPRTAEVAPYATTPGSVALPAGLTLAEVERAYLLSTLDAVGGNKTLAARQLAIGTKTLYRKLHAYGHFEATPAKGGSDEGS